MARFLHTIGPDHGSRLQPRLLRAGFTFADDFVIVRNGEVEATNHLFSLGDQQSVLELTYGSTMRPSRADDEPFPRLACFAEGRGFASPIIGSEKPRSGGVFVSPAGVECGIGSFCRRSCKRLT